MTQEGIDPRFKLSFENVKADIESADKTGMKMVATLSGLLESGEYRPVCIMRYSLHKEGEFCHLAKEVEVFIIKISGFPRAYHVEIPDFSIYSIEEMFTDVKEKMVAVSKLHLPVYEAFRGQEIEIQGYKGE